MDNFEDELQGVIRVMCAYIQTDTDMSLIQALQKSLTDEADDQELSFLLEREFEMCQNRLSYNKSWQQTEGSQIVLWLRNEIKLTL